MSTTPTQISYEEIRGLAEQLADRFSGDGVRTNLDNLIRVLNVHIHYEDSYESSILAKDGSFQINIPEMTSRLRDRFTIAHELGHYILHYQIVRDDCRPDLPIVFHRGDHDYAETQANIFASALLMPETKYRRVFNQYQGDLTKVADAFEVSYAAAEVRAKTLNLKV